MEELNSKAKNQDNGQLGGGNLLYPISYPQSTCPIGVPGQVAEQSIRALLEGQECGGNLHFQRENIPEGESHSKNSPGPQQPM